MLTFYREMYLHLPQPRHSIFNVADDKPASAAHNKQTFYQSAKKNSAFD